MKEISQEHKEVTGFKSGPSKTMWYFKGIYEVTLAVVKEETKQALFVVKGETKHQHETLEAAALTSMFTPDILCTKHVPYLSEAVCLELVIFVSSGGIKGLLALSHQLANVVTQVLDKRRHAPCQVKRIGHWPRDGHRVKPAAGGTAAVGKRLSLQCERNPWLRKVTPHKQTLCHDLQYGYALCQPHRTMSRNGTTVLACWPGFPVSQQLLFT